MIRKPWPPLSCWVTKLTVVASFLFFVFQLLFPFEQLLQKVPELRLSSVESLKSHAYFSEVSFEDVLQKKVSQ